MRWPGLAVRLAARNLRRHPGQALLLLLTLAIATGVLGVAMSLYGSADGPWNRTWRATRGFHVGLTVYHPPDEPGDHALVATLRQRADRLATAPGVVAAGGPGPTCTDRSRSPGVPRTSPPRCATLVPPRWTSRW